MTAKNQVVRGRRNVKPVPTPVEEGCADCTEYEVGDECGSCGKLQAPPAPPTSSPLASMLRKSVETAKAATRSAAVAETVAGFPPTPEQRTVLEAAIEPGLRCLVIPAGAGAGKTSTLKMLETVLPGLGQYTAFNRSLVTESKTKFRKAKCSTTHGLAFGTVGKLFSHRLNAPRVRSEQVARQLGIEDLELTVGTADDGSPLSRKLSAGYLAGQVTVAIRRFCQSADDRITDRQFKLIEGIDLPDAAGKVGRANNDIVRGYLLPFAERAWADLSSPTGTLPFSHDVYVKVWQLGKGPNKPLIPADYILLDEAQDTAPVFLDVLKQQTHALLIFVGDSNQAIYEWRGAVDAMAAFDDAPRCPLSQSFRFGQRVADVANSILAGLEKPTDLILRGLESIPSRVITELGEPVPVKCVLTRTNAAAISTVMDARAEGRTTHLIAGVDEILAFVRAARDLMSGRSTSHPELGCFSNWSEVVTYSKTDEGSDLRLWCKLIDDFGPEEIIAALSDQGKEADADLVVCTAHKSKGREWDSVRLAGDFPPACRMSDSDRRLLYVAATRAQRVLDLSRCTPFHPHVDKQTGIETSGLKIAWTGPMPTAEETATAAVPEAAVPKIEERKPAAPPDYRRKAAEEFTWTNYNGKWCVGGPDGHEGKSVTVVRKNGSTSTERLGAVAKKFSERTVYNLA